MKTAISTWSYRWTFDKQGMDILSFVDEVKRQGAEGFEIYPSYIDQDDRAGHLTKVVEKARSLGLSTPSLIAGNDFARPTAAERAREVENMIRWVDAASAAGITIMNVFTGHHAQGQDPIMDAMRVIDGFREVAPVAEKRGVLLCVENHSSVHPDADGIMAIIRGIGSPCMRTNPDPTNFCPGFTQRDERGREVIYRETEKIAPLTANAHLKINTFDADGNAEFVDVPRILGIFKGAGYDGNVILEYFGEGDPSESVAKGVAQLKRLFAEM